MTRPHLDPRLVLLVGFGGALGTGARYALTTALPPGEGAWPWATFAENVAGAFLLGLLLEVLVRRGTESPRGRLVRLGIGTGVLGGFTTFSSLGLELDRLLAAGAPWVALGYAAVSVVVGLAACFAGVALGARRGRGTPLPPAPRSEAEIADRVAVTGGETP